MLIHDLDPRDASHLDRLLTGDYGEGWVDVTDDLTLALDGQPCRACQGTLIAFPVEANQEPRVRCRDCGIGNTK